MLQAVCFIVIFVTIIGSGETATRELLTCPPRNSSSVDVTCKLDGKEVDCSEPLVEGAVVISKCKQFYTQVANEIPMSTCSGGSWDLPLVRCVPECGELASDGTTYVVNSFNAKKSEFPWHVGLYRFMDGKHEYQCGGSIITPLIIITAAHCFTDESGKEFPAEEYFIGAGKYYSDYNSPDDKFAQTRQIKSYFIPPDYRGYSSNYAGDLAVAVVKKSLQLSNVVLPVCIEWDNKIEPQQLTANNRGSVVGWGYVDPNNPKSSAELKQLNAPYIDKGQCLEAVPQRFQRWVTPDKFCAGFTNGSSVCEGDSGGGMVFPWKTGNRQKFYIRGIVSVGPFNKGVCDNSLYGVYTQVSFYKNFILEIIDQNQVLKSYHLFSPRVRCADGSCVPYSKVCNGTKDCADGAAEFDNCNPSGCNQSTFQCNYIARDGSAGVGCPCRTKFQCGSGECVFFHKVCDGIPDCADSSDETHKECKNVPCPDHAFRCSYGACVDWDYRCNGQQECADSSDEDPTICGGGPAPPLTNGMCPALSLRNGQVKVLGKGYVSRTPIPNYAQVKLTCNKGFALYPANDLISCVDGAWNFAVPQCKLTCPLRISSSVDVTCKLDDKEVDCRKPLIEGSVVTSKCKQFYSQAANEFPISTCSEGSWDNPLIRCVPECGERIPDGTTYITNSFNSKKGEFPWHVGTYRLINGKHKYQCGGSIITPLIIITAAHCFTDIDGTRFPAEEYFIGAGKYYSDYNSPDDKFAQTRQVKNFYIPPDYRGYKTNFAGDLAVAVVKKKLQLSNVVLPICVEWENKKERQHLTANNRGSVVGWGYVDPNKPTASAELKQLNAAYIDLRQCLQVVPQNFQRWVTTDKFCAGFTNGSSMCKGDSGGGIVFPWKTINQNRFYIRGILSVGPANKGVCDNFQYGVYTQVSFYKDFILGIIGQNQVTD